MAHHMRLHIAIMQREGTAYVVGGDKDYVCAKREGTETMCYVRRDHAHATGA